MGKKGDLSLSISQKAHKMGFHAQPFLGFTKNGVKRVKKHPVCGSPVGENAMLMLEVRGEWAD